MLGHQATARVQRGRARAVLQDEALRVLARLDVLQRLAHRLLRLVRDDLRTGHVLAVLGIVGDRVVHVGDAALVDEVDDQLQLVQALEVRHFRRVARFDQCLEAALDQFDGAAAQHGLLAEQVGLGLLAEVRLDDARPPAADRTGVGQCHVARDPRLVLVDGHQHRHAAALGVRRAHRVPRRLGRDHHHVEVLSRRHLAVVDVEPVGERERRALLDVRLDLGLVGRRDVLVGHQHHHEVGALDRGGDLLGLQARLLDLVPRRAALANADRDLDAGVVEVLRVRVALRAVADDRHLAALDELQVAVLVVEDLHVRPFPW